MTVGDTRLTVEQPSSRKIKGKEGKIAPESQNCEAQYCELDDIE